MKIAVLAAFGLLLPWTAGHGRVSDRTRSAEPPDFRCVAWAPAGDAIATGDDRGRVVWWDPDDGRQRVSFATGHGTVRSLAFARAGAGLVSAGDDGRIREWDRTDRLLGEWPGGKATVAFSAEGTTAASADVPPGRRIVLRRLEPDAPATELADAAGTVDAIAFAPDGSTLAASVPVGTGDVRIRLWDTRERAIRASLSAPSYVHAIAFSPDGARLASGGDARDLAAWDLRTGRRTDLQHGDDADRVHAVAFSPDGTTLYAGGRFFGVRAWDLETGRSRALVAGGLAVGAIAPSPDGRRLALLRGRWHLAPLVVDAETGRAVWPVAR